MQVWIDASVSPRVADICTDLCEYVAQQLKTDACNPDDIIIDIEFDTDISYHGMIRNHDDDPFGTIEENEYQIQINPDLLEDSPLLSTLAHEMVHVMQHQNGYLEGFTWHGENMEHIPYREQPWEIEAHTQEAVLAAAFARDRGIDYRSVDLSWQS